MKRWLVTFLLVVSGMSMAKPPRLTVFISVDALGTDVLQRNRFRFKGGFARLMNEGAVYPTARYELIETVTGIGHATLATGAWPHRHGVVGNKVFNRTTGKLEACFADATHPVLEAPAANDDVSPANLMAETLADRLRQTTQLRGKAVAVAGKGRSSSPT